MGEFIYFVEIEGDMQYVHVSLACGWTPLVRVNIRSN